MALYHADAQPRGIRRRSPRRLPGRKTPHGQVPRRLPGKRSVGRLRPLVLEARMAGRTGTSSSSARSPSPSSKWRIWPGSGSSAARTLKWSGRTISSIRSITHSSPFGQGSFARGRSNDSAPKVRHEIAPDNVRGGLSLRFPSLKGANEPRTPGFERARGGAVEEEHDLFEPEAISWAASAWFSCRPRTGSAVRSRMESNRKGLRFPQSVDPRITISQHAIMRDFHIQTTTRGPAQRLWLA